MISESYPERLRRSASKAATRAECSPADVADPYYALGIHPDLAGLGAPALSAGEEWVFGGWNAAEHESCRAAYEHAAP